MTAATDTLTDFLLARIVEDEAVARHAPFWSDVSSRLTPRGIHNGAFAAHLTPARVLAECEAKRRIVAIHVEDRQGACSGCGYSGDLDDPVTEKVDECPELQAFAAIYADHSDYRDEWRP